MSGSSSDRVTRSGAVFNPVSWGASPFDELPRAAAGFIPACPDEARIVKMMSDKLLDIAAHNKIHPTGNVAGLIAGFLDDKGFTHLYEEYAYSNSSALSHEDVYKLGLSPKTTDFTAEFSEQKNSQSRNHTEPKLLQEFADRMLYEGSPFVGAFKWAVLVSDRPVCGNCASGSVKPFVTYCRKNHIDVVVYHLSTQLFSSEVKLVQQSFD